ncbi:MAG: hypothetical protein H7Y17_09170 [Chlorobia bacterium]|nr:hypothetical protein [Fimbriimonadaceae bacterium]
MIGTLISAIGLSIVTQRRAWPDLSVIGNYPNKFGNQCTMEGLTKDGNIPPFDKARSNSLKNRFKLPASFTPISLTGIAALPSKDDAAISARAVSVVGYVQDLFPAASKGESCNCYATKKALLDAHLDVVLIPDQQDSGKGKVVMEVTERSRRLALQGLLPSNIGKDWSSATLRSRLLGRWVRFSGWLFFDPDHATGAWSADPRDRDGEKNWRATAWEVHPIMGIEVLSGPPPEIRRMMRNRRIR